MILEELIRINNNIQYDLNFILLDSDFSFLDKINILTPGLGEVVQALFLKQIILKKFPNARIKFHGFYNDSFNNLLNVRVNKLSCENEFIYMDSYIIDLVEYPYFKYLKKYGPIFEMQELKKFNTSYFKEEDILKFKKLLNIKEDDKILVIGSIENILQKRIIDKRLLEEYKVIMIPRNDFDDFINFYSSYPNFYSLSSYSGQEWNFILVDVHGLSNLFYQVADFLYIGGGRNLFESFNGHTKLIYDLNITKKSPNYNQIQFLKKNKIGFGLHSFFSLTYDVLIQAQNTKSCNKQYLLQYYKSDLKRFIKKIHNFFNNLK